MVRDNALYWISVGDSPLYLFDGEDLHQINEDHSMAPQIDLMAKAGMIDEETARNHPDRNCLTSVLMGAQIPKIDCRESPVNLAPGHILIVSSDGLQFLTNDQIKKVVAEHKKDSSERLASALMSMVQKLDDPDQDNISFAVIKIS